jgi:hypothetical protein
MGCIQTKPNSKKSKYHYKVEKLLIVYKNGVPSRYYLTGDSCTVSSPIHSTGFIIDVVKGLNLQYIPSPKLSEWIGASKSNKNAPVVHKIISIEDACHPVYISVEKVYE